MSSLFQHSGLDILSKQLDLKMESSKEQLAQLFSVKTPAKKISQRKKIIQGLKGQDTERWERYAELETKCRKVFQNLESSENSQKLFKDTVGQLSFQNEYFKQLNYIPYVLVGMAFYKIWVVPFMALLTPLLMVVLPYFIVRFMYSIPMNVSQYIKMMQIMWFSEKPTLKHYGQLVLVLINIIQGIIQPVQNGMHCNTTDTVVCDIGETVLELRDHLEDLREDFQKYEIPFTIPTILQSLTEKRQAFMFVYHNKFILEGVWKTLGELEILWKFAQRDDIAPVKFVKAKSPVLQIPSLRDITISNPVISSLEFKGEKGHALLTGPNGGGKSSSLRAVLQTVLLGQTFGYAASTNVYMTRFSWVSTGLHIADSPGQKSLFENEVRFAVKVLKREEGFGLVLYDEIFHSTNPPDCAHTAKIFLERLWKKNTVLSIVSTHVFEIVESAPKEIQRLCVDGTVDPASKQIRFEYELKPGVSKLSSVDTILKREGLL